MLSAMKELIPGAQNWPRFVRNKSEQFEARVCMVEITKPINGTHQSIFLEGMEGSKFPIPVAHGEGRIEYRDDVSKENELENCCIRFVDPQGSPTEVYPYNPNGSKLGATGDFIYFIFIKFLLNFYFLFICLNHSMTFFFCLKFFFLNLGFVANEGRTTIWMPHPERAIRTVTNSYVPDEYKDSYYAPPMWFFYNARKWVEKNH